MKLLLPAAAVLSIAAVSSLLTGCSEAPGFPNTDTSSSGTTKMGATAGMLHGILHGGQQPIVGARIYLLAAGTSGYGSPSTSLLTRSAYPNFPTQQDGNGLWYTTTDVAGNFQIVDACTPGQQVYVASIGGNAGAGSNSAATELAALGTCPGAGNFDSTLTGVFISEISTVAAAYATAAFAKDPFDIGSPSSGAALVGIANAFANAANLFDVQNINDLARTVTISGNGVVPQAKIHTLANILAACINSTGPGSAQCGSLFGSAQSAGNSGTVPADVATAAINMAHNPWVSPAGLFSLQTPNSPFSPQLSAAPVTVALSISYANAALGDNPSLAVDGSGNVWTLVPNSASVSKLSPTGALLSGTGYAVGSGFANGRGLAVDTGNNVWVLGQVNGVLGSSTAVPTFAQLSSTGVTQKTITEPFVLAGTYPPTTSTNLVLDAAGNAFYAANLVSLLGGASLNCCTVKYNLSANTVSTLDSGNASPGKNFVAVNTTAQWSTGANNTLSYSAGTASKQVTGGGLSTAVGMALDSAGRAWVVNSGSSSVSAFSSTGTAITGTTGYTGGLSTPQAVAVDGLGNAWVTNNGGTLSLSEFNSSGAVLGTGYGNAALTNAGALVLDSSGNAWVASTSSSTVVQFLGIVAPVVTPMSSAIGNSQLGVRP